MTTYNLSFFKGLKQFVTIVIPLDQTPNTKVSLPFMKKDVYETIISR